MNTSASQALLAEAKRTLLDGACAGCSLQDGILSLMGPAASRDQSIEIMTREEGMKSHREKSAEQIMEKVSRHHSLPVMGARAAAFRRQFQPTEWVLDIGGGTGWYWRATSGANVALVDFSLESLQTAQKLLGPMDRVLLIHADASRLPFQPNVLVGFWSVQVLQHLPPESMVRLLAELRRVGKIGAQAEFYNLNYAWLHRVAYRLLGRRLHRAGILGDYLLNRLTAKEWCEVLLPLYATSAGLQQPETGYSELFFQPNFRLLPKRYPTGLEDLIVQKFPSVAALFARQVHVRIKL